MADPIFDIAVHMIGTQFDNLPASAVHAAKTFVLDSFGVGLAGSSGPLAAELVQTQVLSGSADDARVWGFGTALPASAAAMCNAYQIHNSEFDCIHEEAVVHVMAIVLPVIIAGAERMGNVSGKRIIEAAVLGADVAAGLGVASKSGLRFFRPAITGAFGGAAALGKLMGFNRGKLVNALSLTYGQLCGTMQAHTEGSMLLATQIGFNARNAVVACDLAAAGFEGPKNILDGEFGLYTLFEDGGDTDRLVRELGQIWRIEEVAHKPFPSGRATHGVIDGCLELQRAHGIEAGDIEQITARVPALVHQLVGRPVEQSMSINYARLCAQYVSACALIRQGLSISDFNDEAYRDQSRQDLARRIELVPFEAENPSALLPIHLDLQLKDGTRYEHEINAVYGAPAKPMSRDGHLAKFRSNCKLCAKPLPDSKPERLVELIDSLENQDNLTEVLDCLVA